jgi:short-subunit dehydrogenase
MNVTAAKVVLLTGASSGIGAELAKELARKGCRLVLTARRADRLEAIAAECRGLGAEVVVILADLSDTTKAEGLIADTVSAFGGLDVVVNNAGFGVASQFSDADPAALVRQLDVNLVTPIVLTRHALPHLIGRKGTIINVGSSITAIAIPAFGVYGATKAGLAYWNDALRREVRRLGVKVCLVEPGPVTTEFFDAIEGKREGEAPPWESRPPASVSARADDAARRIARLIDRPKRRISMLRRFVWPYRIVGAFFRLVPALGDLVISSAMGKPRKDEGSVAGGTR